MPVRLTSALELHPQVALRPEPFGALAYHYGNRRLVFLKHPDVVRVVRALADHPSLGDTLTACGIDAARRGAFVTAVESLRASDVVRVRGDQTRGEQTCGEQTRGAILDETR